MTSISPSGVAGPLQRGLHTPAFPPPGLAATPGASSLTESTSTPSRRATVRLTPRVQIWDMSSGVEQPVTGEQLLATNDPTITRAYMTAAAVDSFLSKAFGRSGWDGKGSPMRIVVHAPNEDGTPNMNNAYWDNGTKRIYLGDGDGQLFKPLGGAFDVVVHEATHAIVDSEVHLRYEGQQGGINESWADVFATLADPTDWRIGEKVFTPGVKGDAIRDLERPRFNHVSQLPTGSVIEPHDYSGIPSLAAVRVARQLGRTEMGRIWYSALVDHLDSRAGFSGAARATLEAAAELHGASSSQVAAVLDAWKSVGVDPRWKPAA